VRVRRRSGNKHDNINNNPKVYQKKKGLGLGLGLGLGPEQVVKLLRLGRFL